MRANPARGMLARDFWEASRETRLCHRVSGFSPDDDAFAVLNNLLTP